MFRWILPLSLLGWTLPDMRTWAKKRRTSKLAALVDTKPMLPKPTSAPSGPVVVKGRVGSRTHDQMAYGDVHWKVPRKRKIDASTVAILGFGDDHWDKQIT